MGSLFRRQGEKRYSIAWVEDGRRRTKRSSADKRVAAEELRQLELRRDKVALGMPVADACQVKAMGEALDDYRAELLSLGRVPRYVRELTGILTAIATAAKWPTVAAIRADAFAVALTGMVEGGLALTTRNRYHRHMLTFVRWCRNRGWIDGNPLEGVGRANVPTDPAKRVRARRALTTDEFRRLIACPKIKRWRRDLYHLAGLSGLRYSELGQLERQDFTLGPSPTWHVRAAATKAGRLDRIPMLPEAAALLETLLPPSETVNPRRRLFPRRPHRATILIDMDRAGIPRRDAQNRAVSFHSLRMTFCTLCAVVMPITLVQRLMRHRDVRLTSSVYLDLGLTDMAETVRTLPPIFAAAGADRGNAVAPPHGKTG